MKVFILFLMATLVLGYFMRKKELKTRLIVLFAVCAAVCIAYYWLRQV